MTIRECYEKMGANYDEAASHLPSEKIIVKYVNKFLGDKSFEELTAAVKARDWETAERSSHTLKGISQNLSLSNLQKSSSQLNDALKARNTDNVQELYSNIEEDYNRIVSAINDFNESN